MKRLVIYLFPIFLAMLFAMQSGKTELVRAVIGGKTFRLEVADTDAERAKGLMNRTELPADSGMVFNFPQLAAQSFWMKNTKIPLDILFLASGRIVDLVTLPAETEDQPTPIHTSIALADQVIELVAGTAKQLGLQVGDSIETKGLTPTDK